MAKPKLGICGFGDLGFARSSVLSRGLHARLLASLVCSVRLLITIDAASDRLPHAIHYESKLPTPYQDDSIRYQFNSCVCVWVLYVCVCVCGKCAVSILLDSVRKFCVSVCL